MSKPLCRSGVAVFFVSVFVGFVGAVSAGTQSELERGEALYQRGKGDPAGYLEAFDAFSVAASAGDAKALYHLGWMYQHGHGVACDYVQAADFFQQALDGGYIDGAFSLEQLANRSESRDFFEEAVKVEWRRQSRTLAKQQAMADAQVAKVYYDRGDRAGALQSLEDALARWQVRVVPTVYHHFLSGIWWEAQTRSGRADLKWSSELYYWLIEKANNGSSSPYDIGVRQNLVGRLSGLGLYAQKRQICDEMKEHILKIEGIDLDEVYRSASMDANYRYSTTDFPVRIDLEQATDSKRGRPPEDLMGANSIGAISSIGSERLSVGDWEAALFYSEWMEAWVTHIADTDEKPKYTYPGYLPTNTEGVYFLRAAAFKALGLTQQTEQAYRMIIEKHYTSYGQRGYDSARYLLAKLLVGSGRAMEVDIDELLEVEASVKSNKFKPQHSWHYVKLVRARVLAAQGDEATAMLIADEVLHFTGGVDLPALRLEALLANVQLQLDAKRILGSEAMLAEALNWCRSQGLLMSERRVYELYVQYLLQSEQYELALEMQQRVLDLIDALNLKPRRSEAIVAQARIYELLGNDRAALAALERSQVASQYVDWRQTLRERIGQATAPSQINGAQFDLAPLRIVSAPIRLNCQAVFTLSNPSEEAIEVELLIAGRGSPQMNRSYEDVVYIELAGSVESSLRVTYQLDPLMQLPVYLTADGMLPLEADARITLQATVAGVVQSSEWLIESEPSGAMVSMVDAAHVVDSPFYLLSVFHHLSNAREGVSDVGLRAVASRPTRIEAYDADGLLVFIDANGNGSLADAGDLVASRRIYELNAVLSVGEADLQLEFMYQPIDREDQERIEIEIQTHDLSAEGEWEVNAIDWLELVGST